MQLTPIGNDFDSADFIQVHENMHTENAAFIRLVDEDIDAIFT